MKHKIIFLFLALAAMIGLATAQSSQGRSLSGSKSGADPATKPLSPKSAPAQHKSSVPAPVAPSATGSTTSELNHLEHQNPHASGSTKGSAARAKSAPAPKPAAQPKSTANGSGVDFKYQKPKGGMQAETPDRNSANSTTSRVKKKK
jgi:hypothetical protein